MQLIRASSYEPGNRAGSVIETNSVVCSYGKFQPGRSTGMNSRNTTKMVEHKLVLFATVIALWALVTLLIKLFRILLKWKYIQDQNYAIYVVRAKLFCLKCFLPTTGLKCSYGKISSRLPRSRRGRKSRDLGNRASPASHMNTSIFLQRKEWRGEISETEPARLTGLI